MAWQLIYTSALRTLVPGQSGYGTVARSSDLREALIQRLEQYSYYQHGTPSTSAPPVASPVVSAHRILDFRGSRYHILTRIQDAGLDFTSRTNHLAQHLVFEPAELTQLPPPAIILAQWNGWRPRWDESPRLLEQSDWGDLHTLPRSVPLPATNWQQVTGDAGSAAALLVRPLAGGVNLLCPTGSEVALLNLFAESLQLLDPDGRHPVKLWERPFTTHLQAEDNAADFLWRGCVEGTPGWQSIQRSSDVAAVALHTIKAPSSHLARLAREGKPKPAWPSAPPAKPMASSTPSPRPPLRLESPAAAWAETSATSPPPEYRSNARPRVVLLDFTSPRVWVPTLLVLLAGLALLAAFVWPGFLKSPPNGANPSGEPGPMKTSAPGPVQLNEIEPPLAKDTPTDGTGKAQLPPLSPDVLALLEAQTDTIPTWLIVLDGDAPVDLPKIGELEGLLQRLFRDDPALPAASVECRVTPRRFSLLAPGDPAEVNVETFSPKRVRVLGSPNAGFDLECNEWYADAGSAHLVRFRGRNLRDGGLLTVLLKPRTEAGNFRPFRLIALADSNIEPLRLSRHLLVEDQNSFSASLRPELRAWIQSLRLAGLPAEWRLRPSATNSPATDLLDSLPKEFVPEAGQELHFSGIRSRIGSVLAARQGDAQKLANELEAAQGRLQNDLTVGVTLLGHENELGSFGRFVKARPQRRFDRRTYLDYLKTVLREIDPALMELVPGPDITSDQAAEAFERLRGELTRRDYQAKVKAKLPAGYFMKHWHELGDAASLERRQTEAAQTVARCESALRLVPPDLAGTPRVTLVLVTSGGKRYPVVYFEDAPARFAPKLSP